MNPGTNYPPELDEDGHRLVRHPSGGHIKVPFDPLAAAAAAAAAEAAATYPPDELRCKYRSTRCLNERARKRNGDLHNFCQMHRERANQNQRNSEQRRRQGQVARSQRHPSRHASDQPEEEPKFDPDEAEDLAGIHQINIPEPLLATDSHPEPTYDELEETALLLGYPESANR
ncbi:hypothetical protein PHYBOEH_001421 [Phytophthora boehmeriae]|uniref:Uncharacterized protein n=1 Tax=Phytophthora boehmeriae TaxID=109152 RepID=A0A8T1XCK0_9STRA|nr:hypothetical protein PHYBOEH_001421 [Phytophthora boehmeriae]